MIRKYILAILSAILITAGVTLPQPIIDRVLDFIVPNASAVIMTTPPSSLPRLERVFVQCEGDSRCYCFSKLRPSVVDSRSTPPLFRVGRPAGDVPPTDNLGGIPAGDTGVLLHQAPDYGAK